MSKGNNIMEEKKILYFNSKDLRGKLELNLFLEKVFIEYDYIPIVFTCTNDLGERYFVVCTDSIEDLCYMLIKVDNTSNLVDVLENRKPTMSVFEVESKNKHKVILIGNNEVTEKWLSEIKEEDLPSNRSYLNLTKERKIKEYVAKLKEEVANTNTNT